MVPDRRQAIIWTNVQQDFLLEILSNKITSNFTRLGLRYLLWYVIQVTNLRLIMIPTVLSNNEITVSPRADKQDFGFKTIF